MRFFCRFLLSILSSPLSFRVGHRLLSSWLCVSSPFFVLSFARRRARFLAGPARVAPRPLAPRTHARQYNNSLFTAPRNTLAALDPRFFDSPFSAVKLIIEYIYKYVCVYRMRRLGSRLYEGKILFREQLTPLLFPRFNWDRSNRRAV